MLTFLVRTVAATVATYLIKGAVSYMASSLSKPRTETRKAPASSPRPSRIEIDRQNIVDAKFEDVSDKK